MASARPTICWPGSSSGSSKPGEPRNLTLLFAAGQGDGKEQGLNRLGHDGLLKRVVGGHWGLIPKVGRLAVENRIEAYNLPQGVISHLYRDIAAGKPGTFTKVGLRTFVDPRQSGGKVNAATTEELVRLLEFDGEEWLFYKAFPIHIAFIRATTADPAGNLSMEREALTLDNLAMAMAAKNSGGLVIAQVERIAELHTLHPRTVKIPGIMVDAVVVAEPAIITRPTPRPTLLPSRRSCACRCSSLPPMPLDERKLIARRAAMELPANGVVNLGIGMPEGVASVANEEKILSFITMTAEPGVIGGVPASGLNFGAAVNTDAIIDQNQQFDFYDGGGLDLTVLGMAECDARGQRQRQPLRAQARRRRRVHQHQPERARGGVHRHLHCRRAQGRGRRTVSCASCRRAGRSKFVAAVEQITFNGAYAAERSQPVLYVTERCVFRRSHEGLELLEVAPGIDIERDILAHMDFRPIVHTPDIMDRRIFQRRSDGTGPDAVRPRPGAAHQLRSRPRHPVHQFRGHAHPHGQGHRRYAGRRSRRICRDIGHRMPVVVNYDHFRIDPELVDAYAAMVHRLEDFLLHARSPATRAAPFSGQARRRAGACRRQAASVREGKARPVGRRLTNARRRQQFRVQVRQFSSRKISFACAVTTVTVNRRQRGNGVAA